MVVIRNASTDSAWPLSNNPKATFSDSNLGIPLWQVVRASTAAPTYFQPEVISVAGKPFVFVDGGLTMYNNPSYQLFVMATRPEYKLGWSVGEDKVLLISIGTGSARDANERLRPVQMNLLYNASRLPSALMAAANTQQDYLCRVNGRCIHGAPIDLEVGDLIETRGVQADRPAKQFTYARYNVDLTQQGLNNLGLQNLVAADVQKIDAVDRIEDLSNIGMAAARRDVQLKHFQGFV
jgi:hypothetical protein